MPTVTLTVALPERQPITTEHFIIDELTAAAKSITLWHDHAHISLAYTAEEHA